MTAARPGANSPDARTGCLMRDLVDPFWIKIKAVLFLVLGIFSAALLVSERPTWTTVLLLVVTVWSFCRLYYFAFYRAIDFRGCSPAFAISPQSTEELARGAPSRGATPDNSPALQRRVSAKKAPRPGGTPERFSRNSFRNGLNHGFGELNRYPMKGIQQKLFAHYLSQKRCSLHQVKRLLARDEELVSLVG
jgi:hypothetical protein